MGQSRFEQALENYINKFLSFKNLKNNNSEEFYFGENNSLKTRLISDILYIRDCANVVYMKNKNATPKDVLPELKYAHERLKRTIIEEFNIEGCSIGWENILNAACYPATSNTEIYTNSIDAKTLRANLNDVVVSDSKGFRYRNSKGIYYCIVLGYDVFAVDRFMTAEEAAAILCHELGHAMQHMVNSINISLTIENFEYLVQNVEPYIDQMSEKDKKVMIAHMKRLRKSIKSNDTLEMEKIGKYYINSVTEEDLKKEQEDPGYIERRFSKVKDEDLDRPNDKIQGDGLPDWTVNTPLGYQTQIDKSKNKKFNIFKFIAKLIGNTIAAPFGLLIALPSIIATNAKLKNKKFDAHYYKVFEETADNFCQIYGLGSQLASALLKLDKIYDTFSGRTKEDLIIQKIPGLDLWTSLEDILEDMESCCNGYPVKKQRVVNLYKAAKFELENNKDLSPEAKKEINKQIESYRKIFSEYVYADKTNRGWFYKVISGVNRDTIETVAKKDKFVEEQVLIPLKNKAEKSFNPEEVYNE